MPNCSVFWCKKRSETSSLLKDNVTFHLFPKEPEFRNIWTQACGNHMTWTAKRTSTLCSHHFEPSCFIIQANNKRRLKQDAVPTLKLSMVDNYDPETCKKRKLEKVKNSPPPKTSEYATSKVKPHPPEHNISTSTTTTYSLQLDDTLRKKILKKRLQMKCKQIKRLQSQKIYILKKKVESLPELLNSLLQKSLITKEDRLVLDKIGVDEKELFNKPKSKLGKISTTKYSAEIKCFTLTLHFYSPNAYRYVRNTFGTCLPAPKTLTKWYSSIDGQPGFTKEAFVALKLRAESNPQSKIYCALIIDEMNIKRVTEHIDSTQRHYGYVDYGFDFTSDNSQGATDVLVFLLVGINTAWKLPIGYFLVKGIKFEQKARLVTQAFHLVHETGVKIKALTCDGTQVNLAMAAELGCCLDANNLQTTILNPRTGQRCFLFLDPCHMLKLVRNALEHYKFFAQPISRNKIQWSYIQKLHGLQEHELLYMANKLKLNHVYFKTKITNIPLPAQVFSTSVADALILCNNVMKLPMFDNVGATADFLKLINDLFDILDCKTCGTGFKQALNVKNYKTAFAKLDEVKSVLLNLETDVRNRQNVINSINLLKTPCYTGFLGFLVCIESAKGLFENLVLAQNTQLKYLSLHKISQDHMNTFFSFVRSHGGNSDNLSARQFEAIYKKLLFHTELIRNERGTNCNPLEKISVLDCTSAIEKINCTCRQKETQTFLSDDNSEESDMILEIETQTYLSPFGEKVMEHIGDYVVFSIIKNIKCSTCIRGLCGQPNKESLIYQKSIGGLKYASKEVIDLCRLCEVEIRKHLTADKKVNRTCSPQRVTNKVLKHFIGRQLFPNIESHYFDNDFIVHNIELAKAVTEKYTNLRINYLSKNTDTKKCIGYICTKLQVAARSIAGEQHLEGVTAKMTNNLPINASARRERSSSLASFRQ